MDRAPVKADSSTSLSTGELTITDTKKKQSLLQFLTPGILPETAIAWPLVTQNYDLPETLLQTQYEKRILDHVLLEKTMMHIVSLGMLIFDDVYPESSPPKLGILGGAGTYATVGARLFYPGEKSDQVGFVVHTGSDFAQTTRDEIESWKSGSHFVNTPERETTRGKNVYSNDIRGFEFLTDRIQVDHINLPDHYVTANVFHLICGPGRCVEVVKGILARRRELLSSVPGLSDGTSAKPIFVWEPMEGFCEPRNRVFVYEALKYVDVFSPNVHEVSLLFQDQQDIQLAPEGGQDGPGSLLDEDFSRAEALAYLKTTQGQCVQLQAKGFNDPNKALVLRKGEEGCAVFTKGRAVPVPAYHVPFKELGKKEKKKWKNKVVDVTGGGNAFLGGFCAGLELGSSICWRGYNLFEAAALYGTVAAGFAIEQVGMPKLTPRKWDGEERWNGELPGDRLRTMILRVDPAKFVPELTAEERKEGFEWLRAVELDKL